MEKSIYCLGDSNTYGYDPRSFFGEAYDAPWPEQLGKLLSCGITNDGVCGRTIRDVLSSYDLLKRNLQSKRPELLILMLGSNDILMEEDLLPAQLAERMESLLSRLEEDFESLPIYLLSPPDIRIPGDFRQRVRDTALCLMALAAQRKIDFLDLSACTLPLSYDGVHLTEEGHGVLARILSIEISKNSRG